MPLANKAAAHVFRHHHLVAVDLGFSGASKSCGVACHSTSAQLRSQTYTFAEAIRAVADSTRRAREAVLILEAPLSAAFDAAGNPCPRHEIERSGKPRWWSLRAGATMSLAALHFCRGLQNQLPDNFRLHLVEGFVTGDASGEHSAVAARLVKAFRGSCAANWLTVACAGDIVPITEWFGQPHASGCPVILQPIE